MNEETKSKVDQSVDVEDRGELALQGIIIKADEEES